MRWRTFTWARSLSARSSSRRRPRTTRSARAGPNRSSCITPSVCVETGRKDRLSTVLHAIPEEDTEKQFQAGILLGKAGAYLEAAPYFGRARAHASDPYIAAYDQTLMLIRGGDYPAPSNSRADLFNAGLGRGELYNLVAEAYLKTGKVDQAYDALRKRSSWNRRRKITTSTWRAFTSTNGKYDAGRKSSRTD